ncbi:hypothetical protein GCM10023187_24120 [Nibrella viscosa]|uniref:histidine kinase n=2 Tax=Nibrella viscosa TaxID=1084524 RepID=A0ABP8KGH1_9BACT
MRTAPNDPHLLRAALDFSGNGIIIYDCVRDKQGDIQDFRVILANKKAEELAGMTEERMIGRLVGELFPGTLELDFWKCAAEVIATGQPYGFETNYALPHEPEARYAVQLAPYGDGVAVTLTDITDSYRQQKSYEEQAALLDRVLNHSQNGITLLEPVRDANGAVRDFRIAMANKAALRMTRLGPDYLKKQTLLTDIHGNTRFDGLFTACADTLKSGVPCRLEHYYVQFDSWFDISVACFGDALVVTFQDISAAKKAAFARQEQSDLIESVLNGSLNGLIMFKALRNEQGKVYDLQVKLANDAAARVTGLSTDDMIGHTLQSLFPTMFTTGLFAQYVQTIETGSSYQTESYYDADGLKGWYEILAAKFDDGVLVSFIDITASKRYQQDLQKSIDELQRSNKNLEQFAYIASHDLQEPLRKITAFGEVLQTQYGDAIGKFGSDLVDRMRSAAQRMNTLIQDLLTFSRISSQKEPFRKVNLQTIVDEVLSDLETAIRDKQAVIDITTLPVIKGDALQLRQLFQNLLSNALKFTKAGVAPHIRIDCAQLPGRDITPLPGTVVSPSDYHKVFYAISITDNGIGFNDKYLDRIFTIFQRLHGRSEYQGTGIGLAIVQKVTDNHQGYVNAHSELGQGATFTVYLPAAEPQVEDFPDLGKKEVGSSQ